MRAVEAAAGADWLITEDALRQIIQIAAREHEPDIQAVMAKQQKASGELLTLRGNVATLHLTGPIFRYANLFTAISGATSISDAARELQAAIENPTVGAIVLNMDSPGGEVAGVSEFAAMVRKSPKPVYAYVDGLAASAAYWIASAAKEIVASDTAQVGSIGVVATMTKVQEGDKVKRYEFVSSQSPDKRLDLESDAGRMAIQRRVDDLAAVFIGAVAENRGIDAATVAEKFGRGDVMIASRAKDVGMVDSIGTYEGLMDRLQKASHGGPIMLGGSMKEPEVKSPEVNVEAITAEARTKERERIKAILASEDAVGREQLALSIACDTDSDPVLAKKLLAAAPKAAKADPLAKAMGEVKNPTVGTGAPAESADGDDVNKLIAETLRLTGDAKGVN